MKKGTKRNADRSRSFAVAGIGLCVSAVAMGAAKEGSQVVDQVVSAFRDNAYPGAGKGIYAWEGYISTDVAFKKNLEISLKYDGSGELEKLQSKGYSCRNHQNQKAGNSQHSFWNSL